MRWAMSAGVSVVDAFWSLLRLARGEFAADVDGCLARRSDRRGPSGWVTWRTSSNLGSLVLVQKTCQKNAQHGFRSTSFSKLRSDLFHALDFPPLWTSSRPGRRGNWLREAVLRDHPEVPYRDPFNDVIKSEACFRDSSPGATPNIDADFSSTSPSARLWWSRAME
jgi:hypothetical protein